MATYLAFHEVDDVDHWLRSPKREEVFGPLGITIRTFNWPWTRITRSGPAVRSVASAITPPAVVGAIVGSLKGRRAARWSGPIWWVRCRTSRGR
jgi:hypothetical protein